jgi:hypothetical protein
MTRKHIDQETTLPGLTLLRLPRGNLGSCKARRSHRQQLMERELKEQAEAAESGDEEGDHPGSATH